MSLKQKLKMKLPFTRKGLEDYLEEMKQELIAHDNALFAQVSAQVSAQVVDIIETMNKLKKDIEGKRVIVMPPTLDWRKTLFQRPQQMAAAYAKKEKTTVIYLTPNYYDCVALAERASDGLWLVSSGCTHLLTEWLNSAEQVIMSLTWTSNAPYVYRIQHDKLIYEYIDAFEVGGEYDEKTLIEHEWLMSKADVIVCTATRLYNQAQGKAKNPILSPNGGDYEFFAKTPEHEISPLIRDKVKNYQCVLGYYGALASWFDYEIVKEIARRHPEWLFVLVGINYDRSLDKSGIDELENILYFPPQPYQDLPSFLTAFDVAIIPFVINEITLSTSPVKLFEYMAGGKPILTSRMPECLKYESVRTYGDADEFCRIAEDYMAMKPDDPYWKILKREALENTWDARTDQILEAMSEDCLPRSEEK